MKTGVGKTVTDFTETANGIAALKYTGQGLYQDLSELPDKFGQKVQYETGNFKKFGMVQDMNDDYNTQLSAVNQSFNRLEDEVHNTAQQIDSAGSLVETEKLKAKLQAVQGTAGHQHASRLFGRAQSSGSKRSQSKRPGACSRGFSATADSRNVGGESRAS